MANLFLYFYFILYFKIPWFIVKRLIESEKINTLKLIAKKGHYKNRIELAKNIDFLDIKNQWELVEVLLHDNIEMISEMIIKKYKSVYLPMDLRSDVIEKQKYWKNKKIEDKKRNEKVTRMLKDTENYKRKFGDGESYKMVKNMLKSPMNIGKWF